MAGLFDKPDPQAALLGSLLTGLRSDKAGGGLSSDWFPQAGYSGLANALGMINQVQKRKAFFSFHFDDVMRVNVVRNAWKIDHPDSPSMRSFYDSSLWEARRLESDESLKKLIREGVECTSTICVLAGSQTGSRRWVRYEIARAVIDNRGLLTVHLNSIKSHVTRQAEMLGPNPLDNMAIGKVQQNGLMPVQYYLFEWARKGDQIGWFRYEDYMRPVNLPRYLSDPQLGCVIQLSTGTCAYDYIAADGHKNIGAWIDQAARAVGR